MKGVVILFKIVWKFKPKAKKGFFEAKSWFLKQLSYFSSVWIPKPTINTKKPFGLKVQTEES